MAEFRLHLLDRLKSKDPVVTKAKYDVNGNLISATVISHQPGSVMVEGPDGENYYLPPEDQKHLAKIAVKKK